MAALDLATLSAPIDDEDPCGPDLEAEDDDAFINFVTGTEMVLPDDYMVANNQGDRVPFHTDPRFEGLDLGAKIADSARVVARTRDLRLLALLAKLFILNKALADFATVVGAAAVLCETFWDHVHPRAERGDFRLRIGTLERLDEPLIVAALNQANLFRSRRHGVITWVTYRTISRQAAGGREDVDTASLDRFLAEESRSDASQIAAAQASVHLLRRSLGRIRTVCAEHVASGPPNLRRLDDMATQIGAMLDRILPPEGQAEAEAAALPGTAGDEARPDGPAAERGAGTALFATPKAAARALDAATAYFNKAEPSSPSLLLLRQSQALVGKSFLQAVAALWPEQTAKAILSLGPTASFNVQLTLLADNGTPPDETEDAEADHAEAPLVTSRIEALALLEQVGTYYRLAEPSSPIPLLIERARGLVGRDFMSLLRTVLPEEN